MVQAIAVMLMVFHHLFGFPERISVPYTMMFDFEILHIETIMSYFGRICISIFAFSSGYGLCKIGQNKRFVDRYKLIFKQLEKFYLRLWGVCILFIPLGYALGVYRFNLITLVESFLGISVVYNAEWWYITTYLSFLLLYPIIYMLLEMSCKKSKKMGVVFIGMVLLLVSCAYRCLEDKGFWCWFLCFVMGMVTVEFQIFDAMHQAIQKMGKYKPIFIAFGSGGICIARILFSADCEWDYLFTPLIIFFVVLILKSKACTKQFRKLLFMIGKYSTYIWLTHTFYAYYYFQELVYCVKYSALIFVWCLICSWVTGYVLECGVQMLKRLIGKK